MKLTDIIKEVCEIAEKNNVSPKFVYDLIEFQDFKRTYREGKSDLKFSTEIIKRYYRKKGR